jgi:ribosome maturation factor RimP
MTFKEKSKFIVDWSSCRAVTFLIDLAITDAFKVIITLDDDNGVVCRTVSILVDRSEFR